MNRRRFLKKGALTSSFLGLGSVGLSAMGIASTEPIAEEHIEAKRTFNLQYAPHFGMFEKLAGKNVSEQIKFIANHGFTAMEDPTMRNRTIAQQEEIGLLLKKHNIMMGTFVGHKIYWTAPNLTSGKASWREEFLSDIKNAIVIANRANATWLTVVPGHLDFAESMCNQTANVVETLKQACDLLEPHKLVMVLEPLSFNNYPGLFLTTLSQAYKICKEVASPSCKILFDMCHQQLREGNLILNMEKYWDEIAYFQIGDNPGRNEPTSGEINFKNIFKYIKGRNYSGVLGMEHGISLEGKLGEQRLIEAYRESDDFL